MQIDFDAIRSRLDELAGQIAGGDIPRPQREWGGADVVITRRPPPAPRDDGFYPDPRYVVTPHAMALSWLFYQLRDTFSGLIDGCSKIEFYGRLACAAQHYQGQVKREDRIELLQATLYEAYTMLDAMQHGRFAYLPLAVGGAIHKEPAGDDAGAGYPSLEEVRGFFA